MQPFRTRAVARSPYDATASAVMPVVDTMAGKVRGHTAADGISRFLSIPYGASTAGANRFLPPRPPAPWDGVRDTLTIAGRSPQALDGVSRRPEMADFSGKPDLSLETEDCLTVNVWTPGLDDKARPVMVWFHGGAFSYGSANSARQDGSRLAKRGDVVVVAVNQRLNIFGHLHLAEIGGPDFAQSGNAGTLDMIAALQWVRDNIARFGGDPAKVTVFGESGGGGKVSTLLAMPRARGLFRAGIIQSGAAVRLISRERAARLAAAVMQELELPATPEGVRQLQRVPVRRMLVVIGRARKAIGRTDRPLLDRYDFGPVVDGDVLPAQPFDPAAPAISDDIPIMIGDMKDEIAYFLSTDDAVWHRTLSDAELRTRVEAVVGPAHVDRVLALYRRLYPGKNPAELLVSILTDGQYRLRSLILAGRKAARGQAPVFMYNFAWETPVLGGRLGAPHAMDVPFTFDQLDKTNATDLSPAAMELAARMAATWAAFARNLTPDNPAIPHWPAYTPAGRETMILDAEWRVSPDHGSETRALWLDITGNPV